MSEKEIQWMTTEEENLFSEQVRRLGYGTERRARIESDVAFYRARCVQIWEDPARFQELCEKIALLIDEEHVPNDHELEIARFLVRLLIHRIPETSWPTTEEITDDFMEENEH